MKLKMISFIQHENDQEEASLPEIAWLSCAGSLEHVVFVDKIDASKFLSRVIKLAEKVNASSNELLGRRKEALSNYHKSIDRCSEQNKEEDGLPEWDSRLRQVTLSDNQKKYLLCKGPHQPHLAKFPQSCSIPVHKHRQFSAGWYSEYPHLEYSIQRMVHFVLSARFSNLHARIQLGQFTESHLGVK